MFWQFGIELCRIPWIDFSEKNQAPAESSCGEEEQCQEKEPKTTEAMKDSSSLKHYKEKRKQEGRTFLQEWKKTFVWLQLDETKQEMFCTTCQEFSSLADKNSSFFTGSQLETLKHMQAIVNMKHAFQQNSRGSNRKEVQ